MGWLAWWKEVRHGVVATREARVGTPSAASAPYIFGGETTRAEALIPCIYEEGR